MSQIHQILTQYWGYARFRPLQEEIIQSILGGKDTLALLPTGGGKSLCFQVPGLALEGLCLVISPLIALMKDQVERLKSLGIPAVTIFSGMSKSETEITLENCIHGKIKFLYLSPERLSSESFRSRLPAMKIGMIAVDEAHCISQWGYDFRPAYLKIAEIRSLLPGIPVLALTATATPEVQLDIQQKLAFTNGAVFRKSFERKNLAYVVQHEDDKMSRLLRITQKIQGTGIVYARSRNRTRELAEYLQKNGVKAGFYHAGLSASDRNKIQDAWMKGQLRVVVATNAFGMGIDKGDVRFVVHLELPESLEAYYQEAGRGGRDEQKAYAVLLVNSGDEEVMEQRVRMSFPEPEQVRTTYKSLGNYFQLPVGNGQGLSFNFILNKFCDQYNLPVRETYNSLRVLELQGLISLNMDVRLSARIHIKANVEELYEYQVKNPDLDFILKILLRTYEGLFNDFVPVREEVLCKNANLSKDQLIHSLQLLHQQGIIEYLPASEIPQLTFLEARQDDKLLVIDKKVLDDRKERFIERARAVLRYANTSHACRSQMLLAYFGEKSWHRCGVCDYCLNRNKIGLSDLEVENVSEQVKLILSKEALEIESLLEQLQDYPEETSLKVLEWLQDNEQIRIGKDQLLVWNADKL